MIKNCLSAGKYDFLLLGSPDSLLMNNEPWYKNQMQYNELIQITNTLKLDLISQAKNWKKRYMRKIDYQDQVGHLETRLSPAITNSLTLRTPFSLKAETVRGLVILSTVPLNAPCRCDSTIIPFWIVWGIDWESNIVRIEVEGFRLWLLFRELKTGYFAF